MAKPPRPPPRPAVTDEAVTLIGGYAIERKLGEGGAGRVYACVDERLGRKVAIKVLHARNARDQTQRERFLREARAMARITSPHVVGVYQVGEHAKGPYLVMEYLSGEDLETRVKARGALPVDEALTLVRQVALGLDAADQAGIVHRDVKPANIIVTDGTAKLTDFGLARPLDIDMHVTTEGTFTGTAAFLAPERARGQSDDRRGDIYALGCTLYTLIAGRVPFERETPIDVINAHLTEHAEPLDRVVSSCPRAVARLVLRMMAKTPEARPQTYADVVSELDQILGAGQGEKRAKAVSATDDGYTAQPTGVMGSLKQMGLIEIGQMLELQKKTAVVAIHPVDGEPGEVAFEAGIVTAAELPQVKGEEAFYRLTNVRDGFFRNCYERTVSQKNVGKPTSFLILEALRRADEGERRDAEPPPVRQETVDDDELPPPPLDDQATLLDQARPALKARPVAAKVAQKRARTASRAIPLDVPPPILAPLDDDTIAASAASEDPFAARDTALIDKPAPEFDVRSDHDDSLIDRTAEHPAPVSALDDATAPHALPAASDLQFSDERVPARHDVTALQPMMFEDERSIEQIIDRGRALAQSGAKAAGSAVLGFGRALEGVEARLPRVLAFVRTPLGLAVIVLSVLLLGLSVAVVTALVVDRPLDPREVRALLKSGRLDEARALLADPPEGTRPGDLALLMGHLHLKDGAPEKALAAYRRAARERTFDADALDALVVLLADDAHAELTIDVLVEWPAPEVVSRLAALALEGDYPVRVRAFQVLEERGDGARVDREAYLVTNLASAPSCRERRLALLALTELGAKSARVRQAVVDAANRGRDNVCMERELAALVPRR